MDSLIELISNHAHYAHWVIFGAIILAGMNIPISADVMVVISAVLAATVVPENTIELLLAVFLGCYFSAWVAYWIGRKFGPNLCKLGWFSKVLSPARLEKIANFYQKYGFLTLVIGRFIPFGFRNAIFMTAGISKMPFSRFIIRDFFACGLWSVSSFFIFYTLGQNYTVLCEHLKIFNIVIFAAFSVTVIGVVWYKKRKRAKNLTSS
jgi:membrane-associated protein